MTPRARTKNKKLQQSLPHTEYRFTVKLRGSYAGIHTPGCSCSLRRASGDTNCPSGRTNPDLFYGNKRDQIKMFPLSEHSTQICPRGPAAPAAFSLVYVPVRLRRLPEAPEANRHCHCHCHRRPQIRRRNESVAHDVHRQTLWGSVINAGSVPHPGISPKAGRGRETIHQRLYL